MKTNMRGVTFVFEKRSGGDSFSSSQAEPAFVSPLMMRPGTGPMRAASSSSSAGCLRGRTRS
jgi:hypothetical protein